ncbi:hypothetical protein [Bradyrhizobium elkanii]|uniref:hypothetical protein n=1 Tax=Bradyrhizobium elkanii TaxID=29448 RepID=UPI00138ABD07|nr:hypothetical protein [Bradyrhizobium elkanii]
MAGDIFPPLTVFFDGKTHWLGDGFHRYHAALGVGLDQFECDVLAGGLRDAVLHSCGANAAHGVPRSHEDKRRAVMKLLQDDEWSHWSDREIGRHAKVHHDTVGKYRDELTFNDHLAKSPDRPRTVERGGTVYTQKTANIGTKPIEKPDLAPSQLALSPAMEQHQRDMANGFISAALWQVQRSLGELPSPDEAAARFPHHHRHTFTKATLIGMADWLRRFAELYVEKDSNDVAA